MEVSAATSDSTSPGASDVTLTSHTRCLPHLASGLRLITVSRLCSGLEYLRLTSDTRGLLARAECRRERTVWEKSAPCPASGDLLYRTLTWISARALGNTKFLDLSALMGEH